MRSAPDLSPVAPRSTAWRVARTLLVLGLTVLLGSAAHLLGGGSFRPGWLFFACLLPLASLCYLLTRRRLRLWQLLALLGAGQASVHWLLMAGSAAGTHRTTGASAAQGFRAHDMAHHADSGADPTHALGSGRAHTMPGMSGEGHTGTWSAVEGPLQDIVPPGVLMLAAHIAGTLAVAVCLASAEATLWLLSRLVRSWIPPEPALRWCLSPRRRPAPRDAEVPRPLVLVRALDPVRGPPRSIRATPSVDATARTTPCPPARPATAWLRTTPFQKTLLRPAPGR